jgi:hypothetical protein
MYAEAEIDALLGRVPEALKALKEALDNHYPAESAASDPELANLQSSPGFTGMLKEHTAKKP